jgi:hypothetical protein
MFSEQEKGRIARVIDANANRLREGLRVTEEITRLILNDKDLTQRLKEKRHAARDLVQQLPVADILLAARDSLGDVGVKKGFDSLARKDIEDILRANLRRSQESCRVLEEFSKLFDGETSESFKGLRFDLYTLEKRIIGTLHRGPHETPL